MNHRIYYCFAHAFISFTVLSACATSHCPQSTTKPAYKPNAQQPRHSYTDYILSQKTIDALTQAGIDATQLRCNSSVFYNDKLYSYSKAIAAEIDKIWQFEPSELAQKKAARIALGYLVRATFEAIQADNLGLTKLDGYYYQKDGQKHPLLLFRSGVMVDAARPDSCLTSLLEHANLKHIINLYSGAFPLHDFIEQEAKIAKKYGASHHNEAKNKQKGPHSWRESIEHKEDYPQNKHAAMQKVAQIIQQRILRPNGQAAKGNILLHCGGGMHRTGMIFGIIRKCINQDSLAAIEAEYKAHVDYRNKQALGGYEALNAQFIKDFDCAMLK